MKSLAFLLATVAIAAAQGQVNVSILTGAVETPANGLLDFGRVALGEAKDLRIRLRGSTASTVAIRSLPIMGAQFSVSDRPSLPILINSSSLIDISIRFTAPAASTYSGILTINFSAIDGSNPNSTILSLAGISTPAATITVASGCSLNSALSPLTGALDLGRTNQGQDRNCNLTLQNPSTQPLTVSTISVSGTGFQLVAPRVPVNLAANGSVEVTVRLNASVSGIYRGTLVIDTRSYSLAGIVIEPGLPAPIFEFDLSAPESGQQVRLSLRLPSPAPSTTSGLITLTFSSGVTGITSDAAMVFVSTGSRSIPFSIRAGETQATFNSSPSAVFQTGTTSGTITFTISNVAQGITGDGVVKLVIPASPIILEPGSVGALPQNVNLTVTGFDNTYSIGQFIFTFYDRSGAVLGSTMRADFTREFGSFYSQTTAGSSFKVFFQFATRGDVSQIGAIETVLVNSTGKTTTQRLQLP